MNYFRCGGGRSTHTATKIDVAKTPLASFESNVSGLYIPEILAYIQATQAGSGDPSPSNARNISGWSGTNVTIEKNNILKYVNNSQSGTLAGVDYSFLNGRIVLNGTTTGLFTLSLDLAQSANLNPTANKIMFRNNQANMNVNVYFRRSNTNIHYWTMNTINRVAETWTDTGNENVDNVTIIIGANTTLSNFVVFPLLCEKTYTPTTYPITWQTEAGTVYGGYMNVTTGVLTVTHLIANLGDCSFSGTVGSTGIIGTTSLVNVIKPVANADTANAYCSHYLVSRRNSIPDKAISVNPTGTVVLRDSTFADQSGTDLQQWLATNNVQFVYELATPQTYQLTPAQIEQLLGQNNVFCSSGDVEVKYWKID